LPPLPWEGDGGIPRDYTSTSSETVGGPKLKTEIDLNKLRESGI